MKYNKKIIEMIKIYKRSKIKFVKLWFQWGKKYCLP